ncbi:MAG: S66 peptidase family protein [Candidatus Moraniibacteriota bacterium]|jgi:muramoyltetrapeptide carboxypeptidase LdcA involved in peptidoglycan recycling
MKKILPTKLKKGDTIRVIAPSTTGAQFKKNDLLQVSKVFERMGLNITFSKNFRKESLFEVASVQERVDDLVEAFEDPDVQMVWSVSGGYHLNQILPLIDFSIIKKNPKIVCGYSDVTALTHAIYAKTGLVTFCGPNFSTFIAQRHRKYILKCFQDVFMSGQVITPKSSKRWTDGASEKALKTKAKKNDGPYIIQSGKVTGSALGGNLCTIGLLQGTEFMPKLKDVILFIEDDDIFTCEFSGEFIRNLDSLLQQKNATIKGIMFGRFESSTNITKGVIQQIVNEREQIRNIPIVANMDFGHTRPMFIYPIGGKATISTDSGNILTIKDFIN